MRTRPRAAASSLFSLEALAWFSLASLVIAATLHGIIDLDYWWHLRSGQLIVETGAVPRADVFTYSVPGARWIDIHWLFQVAIWAVYSLAGHGGVVLGKTLTVAAIVWVLAPIGQRRGRAQLGVLALGLLVLCATPRFLERPEILSFLWLACVVRLLDRFERRGDAWVYGIVPLQLLWANFHGLFALGIALCAMHAVAALVPSDGVAGPQRWARVRRLLSVTLLACLASLVNPNGLDGAIYPLPQLGMIGSLGQRDFFGTVIEELAPTLSALGSRSVWYFIAFAGLSGGALALNWRHARYADLLSWIGFAYLAVSANRNVALFAIVAAPLFVRNANAWLDRRSRAIEFARPLLAVLAACLLAAAVAETRGPLYPRSAADFRRGLGAVPFQFPERAVDWIETQRVDGRIAHHMRDGGYLIWRLYPEQLVLLDGRLEVFGAETFEELMIDSVAKFQALDERFGFGLVLLRLEAEPHIEQLIAWLHARPDWQLGYVDDSYVVFARRTSSEQPAPIDLDAAESFAPVDGSRGSYDRYRLANRAFLQATLGRPDLALATWRQLLQLFPDYPGGQLVADQLRRQARRPLSGPAADFPSVSP